MKRRHRSTERCRRTVDLALIILSAPLWMPVFGTIAAVVLFTSGRPVLFVQERAGRGGATFHMRKFRSMKNGENPVVPDPGRITKVGTFLRRSSLDELPQLLNVIEGSMSLVGPRPMLPQQVGALNEHQRRRFNVLPGLTGLAQISGRNALSWDQRFEFDVDWASRPTLTRYWSILLRTGSTVVSGDGVTGHDESDRVVVEAHTQALDISDERVVDLTTPPIELDRVGPEEPLSTERLP